MYSYTDVHTVITVCSIAVAVTFAVVFFFIVVVLVGDVVGGHIIDDIMY